MKVLITVFAVYFLGPEAIGCGAVCMRHLVFTLARSDEFRGYLKEFEVLPLYNKILFQTFQKLR